MGLFSSSKSSSTTLYETTENNDASQVNGLQAIRGDGNTISVLDGGAISAATALATASLESGQRTATDLAEKFGEWIDRSASASNALIGGLQAAQADATQKIQEAYRSGSGAIDAQAVIMTIVGAGVLVGLGWAIWGGNHAK